jgi:FkbM family methyltransferase
MPTPRESRRERIDRRLAMLRLVLNHPLNRQNRVGATGRWAAWQAWKLVIRRPLSIRFWKQLRVRVYPDWPYSWTAIYLKLAEYDDMTFTLRYLRAGESFLDVGANIGFYSLLASAVNGGAPVLAFEPHPVAANRLRENAALNSLGNVRVVEAALGDVAGSGQITTDLFDQNRIATSNDNGLSATVPLVTLDGELHRQQIDPSKVALVKIDTEGFEARVLRGAGSLLASTPGPVWIVELTGLGLRYGSDDAEVHTLFAQHGYQALRYLAAENEIAPWEGNDPERGNVIFARDPDHARARLGIATRTPVTVPIAATATA